MADGPAGTQLRALGVASRMGKIARRVENRIKRCGPTAPELMTSKTEFVKAEMAEPAMGAVNYGMGNRRRG